MAFPRRVHDPDAVLDYPFDWSNWLKSGETIVDQTVTAPSAITVSTVEVVDSSTKPDSVVVAWLSGGVEPAKYDVRCHIVTSEGREDDRSITLVTKER